MPVAILPIHTPPYAESDGFVPQRQFSQPAPAGGDEDDYIDFEDPRLVYINPGLKVVKTFFGRPGMGNFACWESRGGVEIARGWLATPRTRDSFASTLGSR